MNYIKLGQAISRAKVSRCGDNDFPVLSITMKDGIVMQSDKFKKRIASKDISEYKVIPAGMLVQGIHMDEGNFGIQDIVPYGIVSPAYTVWTVDESVVFPKYIEMVLRSPRCIDYYRSKLNGTVNRRGHMSEGDFLGMQIPCPSIEEQKHVVTTMNQVKQVMISLTEEMTALDQLIKARFVEMFGDVETNPMGWRKGSLKDHASVIVGYPFPSEGYSSEGIDIVGGYNLMQGYIQWEESKHWPSEEGFESYLLHDNDIVMAMDRPWVNGGFKIARIDVDHLPAILIQRTACIRGKDVEQEFLYYMLDSNRFAEHCNITGSLVPHISNKDINSYQIILPPRDEQKRFAAFVSQVDKSKLSIQASLDHLETLKQSLMQKYFGY